ncbi:hypothetical protein SFRURICE_018788, partial [Spodoptera frugiperda]
MPLYNVHPLFITTKYRKKPSNTLYDPGIEPKTPCPAIALATTRRTRQSMNLKAKWYLSPTHSKYIHTVQQRNIPHCCTYIIARNLVRDPSGDRVDSCAIIQISCACALSLATDLAALWNIWLQAVSGACALSDHMSRVACRATFLTTRRLSSGLRVRWFL